METVYLIMQESIDEASPVEAYKFERVATARLKELEALVNNRYESFYIKELTLDKKLL